MIRKRFHLFQLTSDSWASRSELEKGEFFYEAPPHAAGSLLPFASANGYLKAPALPDPLWVLTPFI